MSTIQVELPDSLHRQLQALAEQDAITVDQFIATALAEKMSALLTEIYLEARAAQGDRAKFDTVLAKVPDVPPDANDALSSTGSE